LAQFSKASLFLTRSWIKQIFLKALKKLNSLIFIKEKGKKSRFSKNKKWENELLAKKLHLPNCFPNLPLSL